MRIARVETMEPRTLLAATLTSDPSFGGGRVVLAAENVSAFGQAVVPLPDGDVLVAGRAIDTATQTHGVVVARYNADGSRDASLGGRGWVFTDRLTQAWAI